MNFLFGMVGGLVPGVSGPIAWEAHIGGFVAGLIAFRLLDPVPREPTAGRYAGILTHTRLHWREKPRHGRGTGRADDCRAHHQRKGTRGRDRRGRARRSPRSRRLLSEKRIGAVVVMEEDAIRGIVSERDIVRAVAKHGGEALAQAGRGLDDRQAS